MPVAPGARVPCVLFPQTMADFDIDQLLEQSLENHKKKEPPTKFVNLLDTILNLL